MANNKTVVVMLPLEVVGELTEISKKFKALFGLEKSPQGVFDLAVSVGLEACQHTINQATAAKHLGDGVLAEIRGRKVASINDAKARRHVHPR